MKKILIVDFSIYRDILAHIFTDAGYAVEVCESAYAALSKLKAFDFDLVISEVELPGDNAFDLYNYIGTHYPYIPIIMTTDKNIDTFFYKIFEEGIGNVICKPVKRDDIVNLAEKLMNRDKIFGLSNYMKDIVETKRMRITSSRQIKNAISMLIRHIEELGYPVENPVVLNLVLNEMTINAVYHSHGLTREKEERVPVQLPEGQYVDLFFAHNASSYGISINDYNGRLSKEIILESINNAVSQNQLILEAAETGKDISAQVSETGRGIDLVRKLCGEYYFIIRKNVRTEIIMLFDVRFSYDTEHYSSLKIIEDKNPA